MFCEPTSENQAKTGYVVRIAYHVENIVASSALDAAQIALNKSTIDKSCYVYEPLRVFVLAEQGNYEFDFYGYHPKEWNWIPDQR